MKMKLIAVLVGSAIAGLAASTANAGKIQASYKNYAAETIVSGTKIALPVVSYAMNRPFSGNGNSISLSLTLSAGTFDTTVAATAALVSGAGSVATDPLIDANPVTSASYSNGGKTVTFTFVGAAPQNFNPASVAVGLSGTTANTAPTKSGTALVVKDVDTVLGAPMLDACNPTTAQISLTALMTDASGNEIDSNDPGALNTTPIAVSDVALNVTGTSSSLYGTTAVEKEWSKVDVLQTGLGKKFTGYAAAASIVAGDTQTQVDVTDAAGGVYNVINVGKITIRDRASLYDAVAPATNHYSLSTAAFPAAAATAGTGVVSPDTLTLMVSGKFDAASGSLFFLAKDAACSTTATLASSPNATFNSTADLATITYKVLEADWLANSATTNTPSAYTSGTTTTRNIFLCYKPTGATVIPTAQFKLTGGTLTKSNATATNPVCPATLYNLGANGVQLDVRNYIQKAVSDATGWTSTLRIINTDETQTANVSAQLIDVDGNLLATGAIVTLKPRAYVYMTNAQIEALLPATVGVQAGNNARLRITAPSSSIRVQNYMYNPASQNFIEASSAQGDDGPDYHRVADGDNK